MARTLAQDRYRILELLGSGTFAEVWAVLDRRLEVERAVKVLRADVDPSLGAQLSREARVLARISHPAVVHVYDVFTDTVDGAERTCVVMEKCDESLGDRVVREGPIPEAQALAWFDALADGLAKAHALGVIHRDVKPHNILLVAGEARLADFGLALLGSSVDVVTRTSAVVGTVAFMAEAVRKGEAHTPETDRYGLAASLVYAVTGQLPGDLLRAGNRMGLSEAVRARVAAWVGAVEAPLQGGPGWKTLQRPRWLLLASSVALTGGLLVGFMAGQSRQPPPLDLVSTPEKCADLADDWQQHRKAGPREVIAAGFLDVNGDAIDDAVFVSQLDQHLLIYPGGPSPSLNDEPIRLEGGRMSGLPVVMDVNQDGFPDIVVPEHDESRLRVFAGTAEGPSLIGMVIEQAPPMMDLAVWDVDGDGLDDLVGRDFLGTVSWRRQTAGNLLAPHEVLWRGMLEEASKLYFPWLVTDGPSGRQVRNLLQSGGAEPSFAFPYGAKVRVLPDRTLALSRGKARIDQLGRPLCADPWSDLNIFGDWNGDGVWDAISAGTCAGCTSALHVAIGQP